MNSTDQTHMKRAIALALQGLYTTSPNPRVGCVLVRDGAVIGAGYHRLAGYGHAEVNALADACANAGDAVGATAYVSLEPCSHTGRTPPCSDALIAAGIARVVSAMQDPNPQVSGRGHDKLLAAGIAVDCGLLEAEAKALNPGFIKRMQLGLPWLHSKQAMSLDGRTAMASGESKWITGPEARSEVQRLRARSCAIISGVDTVMMDDAALTVRAGQLGFDDADYAELVASRQPLRLVLDSTLRLSPAASILAQTGQTVVVAAVENRDAQRALEDAGATVCYLPADDGHIDLTALLKALAAGDINDLACNEVMLEAGSRLNGAFFQRQLIDAMTVYMAATLLGSSALPLMTMEIDQMSQQQRLQIDAITPVGRDWRIDARPDYTMKGEAH